MQINPHGRHASNAAEKLRSVAMPAALPVLTVVKLQSLVLIETARIVEQHFLLSLSFLLYVASKLHKIMCNICYFSQALSGFKYFVMFSARL
jgi:hypothetical protein